MAQNNPEDSGWSDQEFKLLLNEKVRIQKLHDYLDSILNGGRGIDHAGVRDIIEEDRRTEKVESLLEEKEKNGRLEMGGKNTVKLNKALTEFSKCLKAFEEGTRIQTESLPEQRIVSLIENNDFASSVQGENGRYILGGIQFHGEVRFNEDKYQESDYIVLDSLNFPYQEKGFREFIKTQPESGRFDYEELISENVFRDQLPVVIPDVLPVDSYKGWDLTKIDDWSGRVQGGAGIVGNTALPAAMGLAAKGALPWEPVFYGVVVWKFVFMIGVPAVTLPRLLTAVAGRMALFCEKLDGCFASGVEKSEPAFFLYTNKKEAALIHLFMRYPEIRRAILKFHQSAEYGGLEEKYLNYIEEVEFFSGGVDEIKESPKKGRKLRLEYSGQERIVSYSIRSIDTELTERIARSSGEQSKISSAKNTLSKLLP
ncbi:MAG: hypothetical protein ABEJ07_02415 [Candidatus Nanohaloarchaea archaeon]